MKKNYPRIWHDDDDWWYIQWRGPNVKAKLDDAMFFGLLEVLKTYETIDTTKAPPDVDDIISEFKVKPDLYPGQDPKTGDISITLPDGTKRKVIW